MVTSDKDAVLEVIAELSVSRGAQLIRRFEHGAGGTSLVHLDGRNLVLKAWTSSGVLRTVDVSFVSAAMDTMRGRGVPIPELVAHGTTAGHTYLIYENVDGKWPRSVTDGIVTELLGIVDAEHEAADTPNADWRQDLTRMLTFGDALFDTQPSVVEPHPVGRQLLSEARVRLAGCSDEHFHTDDIVHGDFAPENLLVRDDRIVGVVDWERCRAGDASLDLVGAIFDIEIGAKASADVLLRLWREVRARVAEDVLGAYVALYAVRYASWAIGTEMEQEVLSLGERLIAETSVRERHD